MRNWRPSTPSRIPATIALRSSMSAAVDFDERATAAATSTQRWRTIAASPLADCAPSRTPALSRIGGTPFSAAFFPSCAVASFPPADVSAAALLAAAEPFPPAARGSSRCGARERVGSLCPSSAPAAHVGEIPRPENGPGLPRCGVCRRWAGTGRAGGPAGRRDSPASPPEPATLPSARPSSPSAAAEAPGASGPGRRRRAHRSSSWSRGEVAPTIPLSASFVRSAERDAPRAPRCSAWLAMR